MYILLSSTIKVLKSYNYALMTSCSHVIDINDGNAIYPILYCKYCDLSTAVNCKLNYNTNFKIIDGVRNVKSFKKFLLLPQVLYIIYWSSMNGTHILVLCNRYFKHKYINNYKKFNVKKCINHKIIFVL